MVPDLIRRRNRRGHGRAMHMKPREISLDGGDWLVLHMMPGEWEWRRVWQDPRSVMPTQWIPARVPGAVQEDARDAGLIPDWTYDLNSRACEWTSARDWVYTRQFPTPEVPVEGVVRLRFEGVDYACHVFLNGTHLGDHTGQNDGFDYDVTSLLSQDGDNTLVVVVEHAPEQVGQIGRTSQVRHWKARFAYDWDWCTRLVPLGIHDSVSLRVSGAAWMDDVQVDVALAPDLQKADVQVSAHMGVVAAERVDMRVAILREGAKIAEMTRTAVPGGLTSWASCAFTIDRPDLWWPNGYGPQPLYEADVTLTSAGGEVLDRRWVRFGVRRVRAVANDDAPEGALPYVLEVNGRKVFIKGWNWAPISHLYGRQGEAQYTRRLRMARNAHCNLLRVWGGACLEKEVFYGLCDELGIMVWQEFIQSSSGIDNSPATDAEYLAYIRDQAEKMIPRRRNHPSLILWCGGNELMHDDWTPLGDTHPALAVLKNCVSRLDPTRLWLPTSGTGPCANADASKVGQMHDVHGPWQYQGPEGHYALYNTIDPLLHAEFGVEGAADLAAMEKSNSPGSIWPPDDTNPLWTHKGAWWIHNAMLEKLFGRVRDLQTFVRLSQLMQAEGLRYAIEANRRRKWHCAGTAPWQFNESWPNLACTNVLDFYGEPRPAYWWCRKAYEPLHPSARYDKLGWEPGEAFTAEVWLNSSVYEGPCDVKWELCDIEGNGLAGGEESLEVKAGSARPVAHVAWPVQAVAHDLFVLRLRASDADGHTSRNDYLFGTGKKAVLAGLKALPEADIRVRMPKDDVIVANAGPVFVVGVRLDADEWVEFSDNYLLIAPGEEATIAMEGDPSTIFVSGLNMTRHIL